jgi:hypothetical protein
MTMTRDTRGFYERTAALYHHARGTPPKRLCWIACEEGGDGSTGGGRIAAADLPGSGSQASSVEGTRP